MYPVSILDIKTPLFIGIVAGKCLMHFWSHIYYAYIFATRRQMREDNKTHLVLRHRIFFNCWNESLSNGGDGKT